MLILPTVISMMPLGEDRDFMEEMYRTYYATMRSAAGKYISQEADMDDVISDSCMQLMRHIPTLRRLDDRQRRIYIMATVRNTAYQYQMRRARLTRMFSQEDADEEIGENRLKSADKLIEIEEEFQYVMDLIGRLPEKQRLVLRMKYQMEMKDAQIARETGLSESSVRKYIERARKNLKDLLGMIE